MDLKSLGLRLANANRSLVKARQQLTVVKDSFRGDERVDKALTAVNNAITRVHDVDTYTGKPLPVPADVSAVDPIPGVQ